MWGPWNGRLLSPALNTLFKTTYCRGKHSPPHMSKIEKPPDQGDNKSLSRYESQKRRDWNTFCQYLKSQRPSISVAQCNYNHVIEFLRYLDQFGKTKVHLNGCLYFGQPEPPAPCNCPLKQAWGSLDALIGRLRAAYEEHGGTSENNPFANGAIRVYLREVRDSQAKARGIPYKKKKKRKMNQAKVSDQQNRLLSSDGTRVDVPDINDAKVSL